MANMMAPALNDIPEDKAAQDTRDGEEHPDDDSVQTTESEKFQGKSDCGFADAIHETLMAAGQAVHRLVGDPHPVVAGAMKETGDFVKDTAIAVRDLGNADRSVLSEETNELVKMMTSKDAASNDGQDAPKE
jgi:hypothetical protein